MTNLPQGFVGIEVKFSSEHKAGHVLYMKPHQTREAKNNNESVLFVNNIPSYCTEEMVSGMFERYCGHVKAVHLLEKPDPKFASVSVETKSKYFDKCQIKGFKVAYVKFEKGAALEKAMNMNSTTDYFWSTGEKHLLIGMRKWQNSYNESILKADKVSEMQKEIDAYLLDYDEKKKEEERRLRLSEKPDDDGWMTVTRKGRTKGAPRTEASKTRIEQRDEKRQAKQQLVNFYSFQMKESKIKQLEEMRMKFEEDKKRIQLMKESRRFRPY